MENLILSVQDDWSNHLGVRTILVIFGCVFFIYCQTLENVFANFNLRELVFALLDLDSWMTHGPMFKYVNSYVVF